MLDSKTDTIVLAPTHGRSYTFHDNGWVYKSETHTSTGKLVSITYSYFDNGLLSAKAQSELNMNPNVLGIDEIYLKPRYFFGNNY